MLQGERLLSIAKQALFRHQAKESGFCKKVVQYTIILSKH